MFFNLYVSKVIAIGQQGFIKFCKYMFFFLVFPGCLGWQTIFLIIQGAWVKSNKLPDWPFRKDHALNKISK